MTTTLVVLAKAPVAGRAKTRLCPPCSPQQAADLACAALQDTLDAVLATPADRRVLVLEGAPGDWLPAGFELLPQRGEGLDERLAAAFEDVGGPALIVGMDTPQVAPEVLGHGLALLGSAGVDAVLGLALDGGYWAIGLRRPDRRLLVGVEMSSPLTGAQQHVRLRAHALNVRLLPPLRDVDLIADAHAVASLAPQGRFARVLAGAEAA